MILLINFKSLKKFNISPVLGTQVMVNGSPVKNWKFDQRTGIVSINLSEGESKISIK